MTPCPAHIARHTIRKGFAPDAPANAADRRTYSSALPAGAVTPQRRAWQSSLLHDARHSRAFFMPGRSAQLLAAVPRVPGRQHRTETTRRRAAAVASITPQTGQQSAAIHRNPPPPARPEAKAAQTPTLAPHGTKPGRAPARPGEEAGQAATLAPHGTKAPEGRRSVVKRQRDAAGAPRRIAWERGECSTNSRRDRKQKRGRQPPSRRTAQTSGARRTSR